MNTYIHIKYRGSGFVDYPDLKCKVGDVVAEALYISESVLMCFLSSR